DPERYDADHGGDSRMPNLNIFIDGSWLFRQCAAEGSLANATDRPGDRFRLDFNRLNEELLRHVHANGGDGAKVGELVLSISIFELPKDFDSWPSRVSGMRPDDVSLIRNAVWAREGFVREAKEAGYRDEAVFRLPVREWMIRKFVERRYQEKQVDTTIVALLV